MKISKKTVARKLAAYLQHELAIADLVAWAESAMQEGIFDEDDPETIASVIGRLGVADVRAFGLTWEDCEEMLKQLGFEARVNIVTA
jgi:cobyrinic acid a,c-diamide synthase